MHAEGRVPARGVRHLDRGDRRAVVAEIVRTVADPGAPSFHRCSEADPLQLAHAVRRQEHAGADLAEGRRLLIDGDLEAAGDQRVRGEQAADSASNDHDSEPAASSVPRNKGFGSLRVQAILTLAAKHQAPTAQTGRSRNGSGRSLNAPALRELLSVRRQLAVLTLLLAFCALVTRSALAGDYPDRAVKIIVPFPAGGTADAVPRIVGDWLSRKWGQPVVIENRTGAAGNIGAEQVYHSAPDGYTLLSSPPPPLVINQNLYPKLGFDPTKFEPVIVMAQVPNALIVNPNNIKASSVAELIEYPARAIPTRSLPPRKATARPRI